MKLRKKYANIIQIRAIAKSKTDTEIHKKIDKKIWDIINCKVYMIVHFAIIGVIKNIIKDKVAWEIEREIMRGNKKWK